MSQISSAGAFAQHNHIIFETYRPWLDDEGYGGAGRIQAANDACDRFAQAVLGHATVGQREVEAPIIAVPVPANLNNPTAFFAFMRDSRTLGPALNDNEVNGSNAIIAACAAASFPIGDTAYALATAWLETGGTMQPIKELGGTAYFTRMYDITGARPAKARELGNLSPGDGAKYCGRGYVQLTGKRNYTIATQKLRERGLIGPDVDLVANPDLAMRPDIAANVMVLGMREGWFTGRDLDDDIPRDRPATVAEFVKSRDIINGTDRAGEIANAAVEFQTGLGRGEWRMAA